MRHTIMHLLVSRGGSIGALERHVFALCTAQAEHHEVHLLADKPYRISCPKKVFFHAIDLDRGFLNPVLYWQILQCLRQIQPHIVHAQTDRAAALLRWLKWLFKPTVFVVSLHDPKKISPAYTAMDGVCLVNNHMQADFPADKTCQLLYNSTQMPPPLTRHEKSGIREALLQGQQQPLIVAIGRLVPVKAFDVLLRAFVGVNARLVIVGDGIERRNLEMLVDELGLKDQVLFLGQRRDTPQLLQAADLCVIPSLRETVPQVMMDALQVGCPVIASDIAGVSEWLSPGLLAPPNNVEALHALLCATLQRLPMLRKNYLPIFLRARQELTVDGMVQRTQDFYDHLLGYHR